MFKKIDDGTIWLFDRVVTFLQDWCFLSQKRVEQIILALYVASSASSAYIILASQLAGKPFGKLGWELFVDAIIGWVMWREHREPKTARTNRRIGPLEWMFRVMWTALVGCMFGLALLGLLGSSYPPVEHYRWMYDLNQVVWGFLRIAMAYVTILDVDGERGRAAALAWNKVKGLFGTSWVVQPAWCPP